MQNFHRPVMLDKVIHYLTPKTNQNFVDCTVGGGGYTLEILKRTAPAGRLLAIDLDQQAINLVKNKIKRYQKRVILVQDNFKKLKQIVDDYNFNKINGVLLDFGLSSNQLQDQSRGFSFLATGLLDMRFNQPAGLTAAKILNTWSENKLREIFQKFGEERLAGPIAKKIISARKIKPIIYPSQLVAIITDIYKEYYRFPSKLNPATKIFQALRIAVNEELENLTKVLPQAVQILKTGGRLAAISYHSLEDRTVKNFFQQENKDCLCPPQQPTCQCRHQKTLKIITKKPVIPTPHEVAQNPSSRSAKLRVAEKI